MHKWITTDYFRYGSPTDVPNTAVKRRCANNAVKQFVQTPMLPTLCIHTMEERHQAVPCLQVAPTPLPDLRWAVLASAISKYFTESSHLQVMKINLMSSQSKLTFSCVLSPPSSAQTNGTAVNGSAIGCMIPAQTSLDQNSHSVALAAAATGASQQLNGSSGAPSPSALNGRYNQGVAHSFIQPNQMYTSLTQNPMDPYSFGMATQDFGSYFQRPYDFNVSFKMDLYN
jgi:hypothetical protein